MKKWGLLLALLTIGPLGCGPSKDAVRLGHRVFVGRADQERVLLYHTYDAYFLGLTDETFLVRGGTVAIFLEERQVSAVTVQVVEGPHRGERGVTMRANLHGVSR